MLISYHLGQSSIVLRVKIRNSSVSTGAGLTGLTNASTGLIISTIADNEASPTVYTAAGSTIDSITTLGTFVAPTAGHCRFKQVDATNHPGIYEIQIADARFGVAGAKSVLVSISGAANAAECDALVPLTTVDPYDVNNNLQGLKGTTNPTAGALLTTGTGAGQVNPSGGGVTVTTNNDKNGYRLAVEIRNGTAQAGASGTITLDSGASATDSLYKGCWIVLTGGTGAGQARLCTAYVGATKVATVLPAWTTAPDATTLFTIVPAGDVLNVEGNLTGSVNSVTTGVTLAASQHVIVDSGTVTTLTNLPSIPSNWLTAAGISAGALNGKGDWLLASSYTTPPTTAAIATAVWTDLTASSDFTTAGSIGKLLAALHLDGSGNIYAVDQFGNQLAGFAQVSNIAVAGGALHIAASSEVLTTGTDSGTGLAGTSILAMDYDVWTASAGAIDGYYQFNLSGTPGALAVSAAWNGYFVGTGTATIAVSAYNWGTTVWERIGTISATTNNVGYSMEFELTTAHTGTGANAGLVRIRFNTGSAANTLNTDRILLGYVVVAPTAAANATAFWTDTTSSDFTTSGSPGAILVGANGIETGVSLKQAIQRIGATTAGKLSGSQSGNPSTEVFLGLDGATTRVTVTADSSGNRTNVVYA